MMVGDEKPPLETITHYGTKGMKWGVRKTNPTTSDIQDARARQDARYNSYIQSVHRLNLASADGTPKSKQKSAVRNYEKTQKDFLTNEDRVTAMRMTNGEKVTAALLTGPIGLVIIGANRGQVKRVAKDTDKNRQLL
jgi:hypothetical protein